MFSALSRRGYSPIEALNEEVLNWGLDNAALRSVMPPSGVVGPSARITVDVTKVTMRGV
jgi:hypothetical protein